MKFSSLAILGLSSSFNLVKGSAGALESSPESTQTVAFGHDESVSKRLEGMSTHQGVMQYPHRVTERKEKLRNRLQYKRRVAALKKKAQDRVEPMKNQRQVKKTLTECDPNALDLGVLACGSDEFCVKNQSSSQGGFCSSRRLDHGCAISDPCTDSSDCFSDSFCNTDLGYCEYCSCDCPGRLVGYSQEAISECEGKCDPNDCYYDFYWQNYCPARDPSPTPPDDTPVPSKNPSSTPSSEPSKNPTPSPTYASAPEFDIVLDSCTFTPGTTDVGDIVCEFDGKGGVGHNIFSNLYAADCESGVSGGIEQDTTFSSVLESGSQTQEESTFIATISLANSAVPTDATSIDFCLKVEVEDSADDVYDWIGQKITLGVALDGTFSTESDLTTTTFDGNTEEADDVGTVTFGVTAYRCDETGETSSDSILELGENFFLCVEGVQDAVIINDIDSLDATKTGGTDLALIDEATPNSNTFVYGKQSEKVVVATRLPATFFEDDEVVTLVGTAVIVTGGGIRKLAQVRIMQESPQSADFSMTVEVESSSAASLSAFGVAAAFGLVATLVL